MKVKIKYFEIKSDYIMATPEYDRNEIVKCDSLDDPKLISYIESKTDQYKNHFKKKKTFSFDYISNQGAVKVEEYIEPTAKKYNHEN